MAEEVAELERRVAGLIERYREEKQKREQVEGQLGESHAECGRLGEENEQLRGRVGELEQELNGRNDRENQLREKLQGIIGQIDTLEAEIVGLEGAGDESG